MAFAYLNLDRADQTAVITLNRPKANAFSLELMTELHDAVLELRVDPSVGAVVITGGSGRFFSGGADVPSLKESLGKPPEDDSLLAVGLRTMDLVESAPKPVIAAINGTAVGGGCELALACHLRIAADSAQIGLPEVTLGIIPGWGGTHRLPRLVSEAVALEWMLTGRLVSAQEALAAGLLNKVVPQETLLSTAMEYAATLASRPPLAVRAILRTVRGRALDPARGHALEQEGFAEVSRSRDALEGVTAFLEKRRASFVGE